MYDRAKYKDLVDKPWISLVDPVGTMKWDGASYFMRVESDGGLRFFSRRPSVKGGFPERTESLPHLTSVKLPQYSGNVYNIELVHTGHNPEHKESHPMLSGILNSLSPKSIASQAEHGPVRAVMHNVVTPELPTYKEKLLHMKEVQDAFGSPGLLRVVHPHIGPAAITKLIDKTKAEGREGVIVTSLTAPESSNVRIKIKHQEYYNLRIVGFVEELDKNGKPKGSMGSIIVADKSGTPVANVGTGFSAALRKEIWDNRPAWDNQIVQVKTMGLARQKLRSPVYNGLADTLTADAVL